MRPRLALSALCAAAAACSGGDGPERADAFAGLTEYGRPPYAIFLAEDPGRMCWYVEETVEICGGGGAAPTRTDIARDRCVPGATRCVDNEPVGSFRESGGCTETVDYVTVGARDLVGSCDAVEAYRREGDPRACMFHVNCPEGMQCVEYDCVCPPGADCGCFDCRPAAPPRCEGDTLVVERPRDGCDANGGCAFEETRTDCARDGGRCEGAACVGGTGGVDAGGANPDGGAVAPDAGEPECREAADCPTPSDACASVACVAGACVETSNPC